MDSHRVHCQAAATVQRMLDVHPRVRDIAKALRRILFETALEQTANGRRRRARQRVSTPARVRG
jgi:hypothetical protein